MSLFDRSAVFAAFGPRLLQNEPLARYTSARVGGPAEFLVVAESAAQLAQLTQTAWQLRLRPLILGGGSNLLVSDAGLRGLVILNRAQAVSFTDTETGATVRAETGANLARLARQCAARGLSGLEWAATIPGTVGGAVYGNAGAFGGEVAGQLRMAEILQHPGTTRQWSAAELEFGYRTSALKRPTNGHRPVVLAAEFALGRADPAELQAQIETWVAQRKRTQPPGASTGSMFKNPPGDYAGRLIEAAGLKGARIGAAEISPIHANFFINLGQARAADLFALIHLAHDTVKKHFDVDLELEVELVGEWGGAC